LLKAEKLSDQPDATLYDHLGDILMAVGEREKAHEAWRRALSVGPNEDIRKKLDTALKTFNGVFQA